MLDRLKSIEERYVELGKLLGDPEVLADMSRYQKYAKDHADLTDIVTAYREHRDVLAEIEDVKSLLEDELDEEMLEMATTELEELRAKRDKLTDRLKVLLLPKDPNDEKNVIIEIRAGTGGEEAALFASDLFRMYARYAEEKGWKTEMLGSSHTDLGGFKEVILLVEGKGAYSRLKFESGVHRVQRIPETESGGRIHTSAATVAVLPEAEEVDVEINPNDLRIDLFCSTGPGGQSVNTTQSAVRITHLPTGIVVSCQDEKSQHKNKDKAMKVLRARVLDKIEEEQKQEIATNRKLQVGSGDRSERIRTYNFPQNRVTDHRIGLTLHRLEDIMLGDMNQLIDTLITTDQAERLRQVQ